MDLDIVISDARDAGAHSARVEGEHHGFVLLPIQCELDTVAERATGAFVAHMVHFASKAQRKRHDPGFQADRISTTERRAASLGIQADKEQHAAGWE